MILVTGAAGENGSAAIREFARRGEPVRALVRSAARAASLGAPASVEVVEADMRRAETLGAALNGVERVLMISSADGQLADTQRAFIDAAKRADVRHIVKFSGLGAALDTPFRFNRMHAEIERYLEESGLAWTHLRPSQFMQTYFREAPTIAGEGVFYLPLQNARLAPVDVEDIAKAAFALLHTDGHEGRAYEITGPEALTMDELAERLSRALDRTVRYVNVAPEDKRRTLLAAGIPPAFADAMDELFNERRKGAAESTVNLSTHEKLGVRPTTFEAFARRNAAIFRGDSTPSHRWSSGSQSSEAELQARDTQREQGHVR
jgi:uncharacterized protein YbjT (DUF2867 family)